METTKTNSTVTPQQMHRIRNQAQDLEGVFLSMLTKEMFAGIKTDEENFGGGFGEDTWRSMQSEQIATTMAQGGGIGLADQLMGEMLALQEAANTSKSMLYPGTGVYAK